jgi:hypothetical protein
MHTHAHTCTHTRIHTHTHTHTHTRIHTHTRAHTHTKTNIHTHTQTNNTHTHKQTHRIRVDGAARADEFVSIFRRIEEEGKVTGQSAFGSALGIPKDILAQELQLSA